MPPTRRTVLLGLGAAPLAISCTGSQKPPLSNDTGDSAPPPSAPARSPEPAPWAAPGSEDRGLFPYGVQAGDAVADEVLLSVRTGATSVILVVMAGENEAWTEMIRETLTREDSAVRVAHTLSSLQADTVYNYAFYAEEDQLRSIVGRFRTAPAPESAPRIVQFNATSCLNDPGAPWPSMVATASDHADFFCLLGDTVYADGSVSLGDYRACYDLALATEGLYVTTASTSVIATWDDHEVDNNWDPETIPPEQLTAALAAFREALPQRSGPSGGIYRRLSWGPTLDVFVLDCRGERGGGRYISPEQMSWFKEGLAASTARFKIVLNSVPINDYTDVFGTAYAEDRWQGYPAERDEILSFISGTPIPGVLWVTGDMHHEMVCHPEGPGTSGWEVAVGPAGSTPNVLAAIYEDTTGHYLYLDAVWSTTRFVCDPGTGHITVTFVGDDGGILWEGVLDL